MQTTVALTKPVALRQANVNAKRAVRAQAAASTFNTTRSEEVRDVEHNVRGDVEGGRQSKAASEWQDGDPRLVLLVDKESLVGRQATARALGTLYYVFVRNAGGGRGDSGRFGAIRIAGSHGPGTRLPPCCCFTRVPTRLPTCELTHVCRSSRRPRTFCRAVLTRRFVRSSPSVATRSSLTRSRVRTAGTWMATNTLTTSALGDRRSWGMPTMRSSPR
jgi:hypothetical protein